MLRATTASPSSPQARPYDRPVTPDELISRYPRIYHTADARAWAAIQRFGLLPANQLRDPAGLGASTPSARRADSELVTLPGEGHVAILRDDAPCNRLLRPNDSASHSSDRGVGPPGDAVDSRG